MTAREDLQAAEVLCEAKMYAQACFLSQQAAEKAVKSLWRLADAEGWGHSVKRLILDFPEKSEIPDLESHLEEASLLDKFYIPTRYPNGLPDLTPGEVYGREDADRGLAAARSLLDLCGRWLEER